MSYKLATIVKNVDIKLSLKDAAKWDLSSSNVLELFEELGFKTLSERIKKIGKEKEQEKQMSLL